MKKNFDIDGLLDKLSNPTDSRCKLCGGQLSEHRMVTNTPGRTFGGRGMPHYFVSKSST